MNTGSIEFHRKMGFRLLPGTGEVNGVPVTLNYSGEGQHRPATLGLISLLDPTMKPIINIDELEFGSHQHGESFQASGAQVSSLIGGTKLGYGVTVVPPGKRAWPFHNHHANEEMFFVLAGSGRLRFGSAEYPIRAGDFIAAPAGERSTAHQIVNDSNDELRYISVSTMIRPEIVEYPDSNKFSASAAPLGAGIGFRHLGVVSPALDYWLGES